MSFEDQMLALTGLLRFGLPETLKLAVFSIILSLMIGIALGIVRSLKIPVLDQILGVYALLCRGIPLMIILLFIYAIMPIGSSFSISILAIVFVESAYIMEIIKGGFLSVDRGQFEAAAAQSLPFVFTILHIILPQVFLTTLPALIGEIVMLLKGTAVASTVGCLELTRRAQFLLPKYPYPMIIYGYVLIIFFMLCHCLTILGKKLEKSTVEKIMGGQHV